MIYKSSLYGATLTDSGATGGLPVLQANWDAVHDSASAAIKETGAFAGEFGTDISFSGEGFTIKRCFLFFDTTGAPAVSSATLWLYADSVRDWTASIAVQEGTPNYPVIHADYNNFTGTEYGHTAGTLVNKWNRIDFNALGVSKINRAGWTDMCLRGYDFDYLDVPPTVSIDTLSEVAWFPYYTVKAMLEINGDLDINGQSCGQIRMITGIGRERLVTAPILTKDSGTAMRFCGIDGNVWGFSSTGNPAYPCRYEATGGRVILESASV